MDKSWMNETNQFGKRYLEGVKQFMILTRGCLDDKNEMRCPCRWCMNVYFQEVGRVEDHLIVHGINKIYTKWVLHGEPYGEFRHVDATVMIQQNEVNDADEPIEEIDEMLEDIGAGMFMGTTSEMEEIMMNQLEGNMEQRILIAY
ncbi:hypothetical protein CJ030_MR5G005112 [Morella rubra]|uniref:Transposase-associated domain-containing protein n=1 Tax=Morella rubra TaxID=262757 RepID=A0A6A1VM55_9ROSI|nr:hypothetical protein CJ030_MR5G005112 [Morella rubra]